MKTEKLLLMEPAETTRATSPKTSTASTHAYTKIRAAILSGEIEAGCRLKEDYLTEFCGVSRTPIREALRKLSFEGLIVVTPHHGAQVTVVGTNDLEEIYSLRAMLESRAAARAATRIRPDQIARLQELQQIMEKAVPKGDVAINEHMTPANAEFHQLILEAADSPRLLTMASVVVEIPLTKRTFAAYSREERQRSLMQHRELISAFCAKNAEWAASTMTSHVNAAYHALMRSTARG